MKLALSTVGVGMFVLLLGLVAHAQTPDRLTDKEVKDLLDQVYDARDKFEGRLEGKVKNGVVRSSTGEVKVQSALEDFQRDVEKLKERYTEKYAASAEVQAVLQRANTLDAIMKSQPADIKGASDWDLLSKHLRTLAAAYRATFPLPDGAPVRRINDEEAAATTAAIITQAEQLKQAVNSDKALAKPAKDALKTEVDGVIKQAKALQSRLKESKPATADARNLIEKIGALTKEGRQLSPPVLTAIGSLRAPLEKINQAFGLVAPGTL